MSRIIETIAKYLLPPSTAPEIFLLIWQHVFPNYLIVDSARDLLKLAPISEKLLASIRSFQERNVPVSIPFRITTAWGMDAQNKKDLVYVEIISPKEEALPDVGAPKETEIVDGNHKLTRFIVYLEVYQKLLEEQKSQLENRCQKPNDIEQAHIVRIDRAHVGFFFIKLPPQRHDSCRTFYRELGLFFESDDTSNEKLNELAMKYSNRDVEA